MLESVAPFVVSLVALAGVVWSSVHSSRTTLRAEDKRAVAAIDAEDRRAAAALEAEDRRHRNAMEVEVRRSTLASRHALYIDTERARKALSRCIYEWDSASINGDEFWREGARKRLDGLDDAVDALAEARDRASLYGSKAVSDACSDAWYQSLMVAHLATPYLEDPSDVNRSAVTEQARIAGMACERLLAVMRSELGSAD